MYALGIGECALDLVTDPLTSVNLCESLCVPRELVESQVSHHCLTAAIKGHDQMGESEGFFLGAN